MTREDRETAKLILDLIQDRRERAQQKDLCDNVERWMKARYRWETALEALGAVLMVGALITLCIRML